MSRFTESFTVTPGTDGKMWIILFNFRYEVGAEVSGDVIDVPIEFRTEFASVPRSLGVFLRRWGMFGNTAIIHDYRYWVQPCSRIECDDILLERIVVLEVGYIKRCATNWAIRLGRWGVWSNNQ